LEVKNAVSRQCRSEFSTPPPICLPLPFTLTGGVLVLLIVARFWTEGEAMAEEKSAQAATTTDEPFMMDGCQSYTRRSGYKSDGRETAGAVEER
jgi:hypothetical protein